MEALTTIGVIVSSIIVALVLIGLILSKLYVKTQKEFAFVRTGLGGETVIKDGGAIVIGLFQEVIKVNMTTMKLRISRRNTDALITKDKMRVDCDADFYVRVNQSKESIAIAAQTLGEKTTDSDKLKELIEAKFIDGLRSVAAEMDMNELHEKRPAFVQKVQQTVMEDLAKNGLELESVSLTSLDQTSKEYFNADNAFDAQGLRKLTEITERAREDRNSIEQDTRIAIEKKDLESEKLSLDIAQQSILAQLEQDKQIKLKDAEQKALISAEESRKRQEAMEATILADKLIEEAQILKKQALKEAEIQAAKNIEEAEIKKRINISERQKEEADAQSKANESKAKEIESQEAILTAKEIAEAKRNKELAIIEAEEKAESLAIEIKVQARSEKEAAIDRAHAIKVSAQGEADAIIIKAEAEEKRLSIEAAGQELLNNAANTLDRKQIDKEIKLKSLEVLPAVVKEMVKPIEKIDSIKLAMVNGLGNNTNITERMAINSEHISGSSNNLANDFVNAALAMKLNIPLVNELMKSVGITDSSKIESFMPVGLENHEMAEPIENLQEEIDQIGNDKD